VVGWSRSAKSLPGIRNLHGSDGFAEAMKAASIVVCLLPLTDQTRGILDAKAFALMPAGGYIINMGRGPHVVAADLIAALDSGHLAGATLDVTEPEPLPEDDPLWTHPKVTITPHIAGLMPPRRIMQNMADTVRRCVTSGRFDNTVDLDRGY
jgi:glyoxylate/hydroxypyruvate reductase A